MKAEQYGQLGFEFGIASTSEVKDADQYAEDIKRKYAIPEAAREVYGVEGLKIGYSELAIHCEKAGKLIRRIWTVGSYGYGLLIDGGFIHGCINFNSGGWVSFT